MSAGVGLPGALSRRMAGRRSRAQFALEAADLSLTPRAGPALTLSRGATGGLVRGADGRGRAPAYGAPRWHMFDRDGDGIFETPTLRLEPQSRNLLLRSQEFDNASWTKTRSSITANAITAPDGTLTADKLVEDSTASQSHYVFQNVTLSAAGARYALSCFALAGERTQVMLRAQDGGANYFGALFDLATQAVTQSNNGTFTHTRSYMEAWLAVGGQTWYRCVAVGIAGTGTTAQGIILLASGGNTTYSGDGASGAYLWGAQIEETENDATSYMATTTATVQRSLEGLTATWLPVPGPMTIYYRGIDVGQGIEYVSSKRIVHIGDGTTRAILMQSTTVQCQNDNGPNTSNDAQTLNAMPRLTDLELCGTIYPDGHCLASYAYDQGDVVAGSGSGALAFASAYGGSPVVLGIGSQGGTAALANLALRSVRIIAGAKDLLYMRNLR